MGKKAISAEKDIETDLFGAPITQIRERWGRKSFAKTHENQTFVSLLVAEGYTHEQIADQVGCNRKTLEKHFSAELRDGAERVKTEMLQILYRNARNGNNAAADKLLKRMENSVPRSKSPKLQPAEPKAKRLGKKESLLEEIQIVPDEWEGMLPN